MVVDFKGKKETAEIDAATYVDGEIFAMLLVVINKDGREASSYVDIESGRVELDGWNFTAAELNALNERYNSFIWKERGNADGIVKAVEKAVI